MSRSRPLDTEGLNQLAAARDGYLLYNRNDYYIGRSLEQYGEFSALEIQLFAQEKDRAIIHAQPGRLPDLEKQLLARVQTSESNFNARRNPEFAPANSTASHSTLPCAKKPPRRKSRGRRSP